MKICSKFQYVCTYVHKQLCKCLLVCPCPVCCPSLYPGPNLFLAVLHLLSSFCLSQLHLWAWFILHKIKSVSPNHLTQLVLITLWSPTAGTREHSPPLFFVFAYGIPQKLLLAKDLINLKLNKAKVVSDTYSLRNACPVKMNHFCVCVLSHSVMSDSLWPLGL